MFPSRSEGFAASSPLCALPPETLLSEAIARYLLTREQQDGLALETLSLYRQAAWSLLEFLKSDPAIGTLPAGLATAWLASLRAAPWALRRRDAYPRQMTPATVSAFLTAPPPSFSSGKFRGEQTVGRIWRMGRPILAWLRVDVGIPKKDRPKMRLPRPWVPKEEAIGRRWGEVWSARSEKDENLRRRVILTQGLVLASGMRIEEALVAQAANLDGHWLLIARSKTHAPRIIYLSAQALGIVEAFRRQTSRGQTVMPFADERFTRLSGWPKTKGNWHRKVRDAGLVGKTHQELRQRMSTWLKQIAARERLVPEIEPAQMGHGGGVVFLHYLDCYDQQAYAVEQFHLPQVEGFAWPEPIRAEAEFSRRLYEEFRRIIQAGTA